MKHPLIASLCIALTFYASAATAGVSYIRGADIDQGELDLEAQYIEQFDDAKSKNHDRTYKLEGYYGLTDRWQIGAGAGFGRSSGDDFDAETIFIEGIYQFIEADDYGFDMAVLGEYVYALEDGNPDKLEGKLLYENEWGDGFKTKANLIIEQQIGEHNNSAPEFASKLATVYKITDHFKPGLEWQAEYGHTDDWTPKHYVGPVAYGELMELPNDGGEIEYQMGYLFGVNDNSADGALRFLLEYEMEF